MFETIVRPQNSNNAVESLQSWTWPAIDTGVWDGPLMDWVNIHSTRWFEDVRNFNVVVQGGGACGMYPRMLAEKFKVVYTFEPHPLSFHCLVQNCQLPNVIKINGALGPCQGFINNSFDVTGDTNMGMNTVDNTAGGYVPMFSIDSFNLTECDMIALDVEGFEFGVLAGALKTIERFKPVIVGERTDDPAVTKVLEPLGYNKKTQSVADTVWACINT